MCSPRTTTALSDSSMASGPIETQRTSQTAHNQLLSQLVGHLASAPKPNTSTHRERLRHAHEASHLMNRLTDSAAELVYSYQQDGPRQAEIAALGGQGQQQHQANGAAGSAGEVSEFYNRLSSVKDFHRRNPNVEPPAAAEETFVELYGPQIEGEGDFLDRMFTGEEALGRYFDLNSLHAQFNNLPGAQRVAYLRFLDLFDQFDQIPKQRKLAGDKYKVYLQDLLEYLKSFSNRAFPLEDPEEVEEAAFEQFEAAWKNKSVASWQQDQDPADASSSQQGIWCAACQKMYSKETVYNAHLSSKKHVKAEEALKNGNGATEAAAAAPQGVAQSSSKDKDAERSHYLARLEALITALLACSWLQPLRSETKNNVERKAALTDKERMQELQDLEKREAEEIAKAAAEGNTRQKDAEELDVEEEKIYNPLKLPLGWDGKPIPFWLYKLHGLGVEYTCEICSGAKYAGRKNFERHFQEARHSFGMKALGLPNTKHFHEITKIEDAIALAERLKSEGKQEIFRAEEMEELEDEEGNVYNKKVYNDLKAQGLL